MSVGVMKDYKLNLRNLRSPHTLGSSTLIDEMFVSVMGEYVFLK
jgi:hypothetical protein